MPVNNSTFLTNFKKYFTDGIDGKQARRTNSSTPLGELFDHGLDSWATLFLPIAIYSVFGRGDYSVGVFHIYAILIGTMMSFFCSHWEKYNTGVLFLPWGYDASQLVSNLKTTILYSHNFCFILIYKPFVITMNVFFSSLSFLYKHHIRVKCNV